MSVMSFVESESGLTLCLDVPRNGGLDPELLDIVPPSVAFEDMRTIDADEITSSYVVYSAYIVDGSEVALAGTVRQLKKGFLPTELDDKPICFSELGTLWVSPAHRRKGVARSLVKFAATTMDMISIVPITICNEQGEHVFNQVGFERVGTIPSEVDGKLRGVCVYSPKMDWFLRECWSEGLREEFVANLQATPRFSDLRV